MHRVPSSDGVAVAVHHLAGADGLPPLLISHANGFHARCYQPLADALGEHFRSLALDHRGHGLTAAPTGWRADWTSFGDDALAVARTIAPEGGLIAFGHSMGASALLMAAHRAPAQFRHLVLFEPITWPPGVVPTDGDGGAGDSPIVAGALRRRRRFESFDAAYANYRSKPPLAVMVDAALRNYVDHGFRRVVTDDGGDAVELRCSPELEAAIFRTGSGNGVWPLLAEIDTPCTVIGGRVEASEPGASEPGAFAAAVAAELPRGAYRALPHQTHFGPFSHPDEIAAIIADVASRDGSGDAAPRSP